MQKLLLILTGLFALSSGCAAINRTGAHDAVSNDCVNATLAKYPSEDRNILKQQVLNYKPQATVGEVLKTIGAHCQDGRLLDVNGREIYLYCNPGGGPDPGPERSAEMAKAEKKILKELSEKYTLVIYVCNYMVP